MYKCGYYNKSNKVTAKKTAKSIAKFHGCHTWHLQTFNSTETVEAVVRY